MDSEVRRRELSTWDVDTLRNQFRTVSCLGADYPLSWWTRGMLVAAIVVMEEAAGEHVS